jgi:8-oxo-dGTP diphosphatase
MKEVAKVFIKNEKQGKYLFHLRDNKPTITNPNTYNLLGGNFEENEKPLEALERELKEESDIKVYDIKELGNEVLESVLKEGVVKSRFYIFLAQTDADLEDVKLYEGQRLEYFTIEEALELSNLSLPIREAINKYKAQLL